MDLKEKIRVIPDFPKAGISFKDITTLLKDAEALKETVQSMAEHFRDCGIEMIVGVESRGFILGAPLAYEMDLVRFDSQTEKASWRGFIRRI